MILLAKIYATLLILSIIGFQSTQIKGLVDESKYYTIDRISEFSAKCMIALVLIAVIVAIGFTFYFIWAVQ